MIAVGGYELYNSVTGGNVEFSKVVKQIPETLNEKVLTAFFNNAEKIPVKDYELANK
jgi:hypothetical protein